jgi:hypothetical protein
MRINATKTWRAIERTARSRASIATKMSKVIDACSAALPHPDWERMAKLPFEQDVANLAPWIPTVLERNPPEIALHGLWFGLCNPITDDDEVTADVYFAGSESFSADDEECAWARDLTYTPPDAYSGSECLRKIYAIAHPRRSKPGGALEDDAEWSLCLAFSLFALQELLKSTTPNDFRSKASSIGVVVGFDDGDFMKVGRVTKSGLVAA